MPNASDRPRRVTIERDGPIVVEGPVEVVLEDGSVVTSQRFAVAVCTCRRSRTYPWCDTSHRRRVSRVRGEPRQPGSRPDGAAE
ncbi:CDGSH iron-sulfur domain-containing protein [Streptomyces sp. NPDC002896]|uniref:CDGSH iron-sulfur domain-containing protein n=1 Tax=Streptomyces sp. NPDC002896 TaxID=3154438 RepID=UPI00332C1B80